MCKSIPIRRLFMPALVMPVLLLVSCNYNQRIPKDTTLSGTIINRTPPSPETIEIWFDGPVESMGFDIEVDSAGHFEVRESIMLGQNHSVTYNNFRINYFSQPGDSIHITIDAHLLDRNLDGVVFSGDQADFNNQLFHCYNYMEQIPIVEHDFNDLPIDSVFVLLGERIAARKDSLYHYSWTHPLTGKLIRWMETNIAYETVNLLADYQQPRHSKQVCLDRMKLLGDSRFDANNPKLFQSSHYKGFLSRYCNALVGSEIPDSLRTKNPLGYIQDATGLIATRERASVCRDYMLFDFIWQRREEPGIETILPELTFHFSNAYIADYLSAKIKEEKAAFARSTPLDAVLYLNRAEEKTLIDTLENRDFFDILRERYAGKVVYLDVYAAEDKTSREDFAHARRLEEWIEEAGGVFVALCLDSDFDKWLNAVGESGITGEHYLAGAEETKLFRETYRIERYPTYMLMDRNGNLVYIHAAKPSEPEKLRRQLGRLLIQE